MRWERRVTINAPANIVLDVLTDLERWPEWNEAMKSVRVTTAGPVAVGTTADVMAEGAPKAEWRVTSLDDSGFTWVTTIRGVRTVADHRISTNPDGSSDVVLSVEMRGFMATLFKPMLGRVSEKNLPREAAGLKRRAESLVTA